MSADVSECLDDFFAKKDKKKKTKKSKTVFTPDDFDPVIEKPSKAKSKSTKLADLDVADKSEVAKETSVAEAVPQKDSDPKSVEEVDVKEVVSSSTSGVPGEEDEWNDFAAEEEADYSGLRIQKLNIQEEAPEEDEEIEYDNDGKAIETDVRVWKVPEAPVSVTPEPTTEVQSISKRSSEKNEDRVSYSSTASSSPGAQKYVPPAQRQAMKAAAAANARAGESPAPRTLGGLRRNPRTAPDINNEELFPTLGGKSVAGVKAGVLGGLGSNASSRGQSPFAGEEGGGGGRLFTDVSLENKWEALTRGGE